MATTAIYTLSLHDALPISDSGVHLVGFLGQARVRLHLRGRGAPRNTGGAQGEEKVEVKVRTETARRSEEHTSELQSRLHLVCRLLLEKKKTKNTNLHNNGQ